MTFAGLDPGVPMAKLGLSVGVLAALFALRAFVGQALLRRVTPPEIRRRWLVGVRNATMLLGVLALGAIWADALRPFVVSLLAVAVAFVIAMKELIQSALASLMRSATNLYSVGDRIEVGGNRGDVVDYNLFTTTIMEVGPGRAFHMRTGRTITFPNSKLLETYVINESYTRDYVNHSFSVHLRVNEDWERAESILIDAARAECASYLSDAKERMKNLEQSEALNGLTANPRVAVQMTDLGKLNLLVRFPVPVGRQGRVEQAITRRFLREYYSKPEGPGLELEDADTSGVTALPLAEPAAEFTI